MAIGKTSVMHIWCGSTNFGQPSGKYSRTLLKRRMPNRTPLEEIAWRLEELEEAEGDVQALHLLTFVMAFLFALMNNLMQRRAPNPRVWRPVWEEYSAITNEGWSFQGTLWATLCWKLFLHSIGQLHPIPPMCVSWTYLHRAFNYLFLLSSDR